MTIARYLRILRGYTQVELADKLKVAQPQISKLENGKLSLSEYKLKELCTILNAKLSHKKLVDKFDQERVGDYIKDVTDKI